MSAATQHLVRLENLSVAFPGGRHGDGETRHFRAVDDVTLDVRVGEVLGIVGESGSGKTTLAKALLRLYRPSDGRILFNDVNLAGLSERGLRPYRRHLQMVFQDPLSSFNPRQTVFEALSLPLRLHRICLPEDIPREVEKMLARVGLSPAFRDRFPHELSGGQLQRVAIGRALTLSPSLLVADEAVSKLDVSVRAQILNLLKDVQSTSAFSILFITHDLYVARYLCHRIGVMYFGRLVELGSTDEIFGAPRHPYTKALLGTLDEHMAGAADADPVAAPPSAVGCRYASRCPHAIPSCAEAQPPLDTAGDGHAVACYRWRELASASESPNLHHTKA
ncbi:MAG TPA: ABC transporter ATP-binding protein [Stellaceae bacterium]|nr:ABC transporter ATP-binding protein [Stellaceae bacterium]